MVCPEKRTTMAKGTRLWFEELTVTPLIEHAVGVLRAAIPERTNVTGIKVEIEDGKLRASYDDPSLTHMKDIEYVTLTRQDTEAARLLIATFWYHCLLIEERFHVPLPTPKSDEEFDARRAKRRAEVEAYMRGEDLVLDAEWGAYERLMEELQQKLRCTSEEIGLPEPSLTIMR
jgi:hypothetical protein